MSMYEYDIMSADASFDDIERVRTNVNVTQRDVVTNSQIIGPMSRIMMEQAPQIPGVGCIHYVSD
jgi:hypothetical protein